MKIEDKIKLISQQILATESSAEFRQVATKELMNLSAESNNHTAIFENLTDVLSCMNNASDEKILASILGVLQNLATEISGQDEIRRASIIEQIIKFLNHEHPKPRRRATGALRNLAEHDINKEIIRERGGIELLGERLTEQDLKTREHAACALWRLVDKNNANQFVVWHTRVLEKLKKCCEDEAGGIVAWYAREAVAKCREVDHQVKNSAAFFIARNEVDLAEENQHLLGEGAYSKVYQGNWGNKTVAFKCFKTEKLHLNIVQEISHEVGVMQNLNSNFLIKLYGLVVNESEAPILAMEYGRNGSLFQFIQNKQQDISWWLRLRIAHEIAQGLAYLHERNIMHCDLKSSNVILDGNYNAKLCDFGLAKFRETTNTVIRSPKTEEKPYLTGTIRWMPPEAFERGLIIGLSTKSDIWSLAMIIFELASRQIPFMDHVEERDIINAIRTRRSEYIPFECEENVPALARIMQACWKERSERPRAQELVEQLSVLYNP